MLEHHASAVAPNKQTNKQTNICVVLAPAAESTEHLSFPTAHDFPVRVNNIQLGKVREKSHLCCSKWLKRVKVLCNVSALLSHEDAAESRRSSTEPESRFLSSNKTSVGCWMHVKCPGLFWDRASSHVIPKSSNQIKQPTRLIQFQQ